MDSLKSQSSKRGRGKVLKGNKYFNTKYQVDMYPHLTFSTTESHPPIFARFGRFYSADVTMALLHNNKNRPRTSSLRRDIHNRWLCLRSSQLFPSVLWMFHIRGLYVSFLLRSEVRSVFIGPTDSVHDRLAEWIKRTSLLTNTGGFGPKHLKEIAAKISTNKSDIVIDAAPDRRGDPPDLATGFPASWGLRIRSRGALPRAQHAQPTSR